MRNPKFRRIEPNYRKKVLEVTLVEKGRARKYTLPFSVFPEKIGHENRFVSIQIEKELANLAATYVLEDGSRGDFPSDFVLYYCDPTYEWSPINQLKRSLKQKVDAANLSVRVIADALNTSPSQVMRLFEDDYGSKQLLQLIRLAELAGYQIEFSLKKKRAA